MPRILMAASEATPLIKTGGLADVVGALPRALAGLGNDTAVVLPRYGAISLEGARRIWDHLPVTLGGQTFHCAIWETHAAGTRLFLIDCPPLFDRPGLYNERGHDYPDNHFRFAAFSHGVLHVLRSLFNADILHLHDWQSALCAAYLRTRQKLDPAFAGVKIVYTIHNLEHQGRFPKAVAPDLGLDPWLMRPEFLEFWGDVNFMKAGIVFADAITTVSPRYAEEIQTPEFGCGLEGVLGDHRRKLVGILNGCDYGEWDPATDPLIARKYSAADLSGKKDCKLDVLLEFGLHGEMAERPLAGMVTRLARQKGIDLLMEIGDELLATTDVCLVAVASGEARYEAFFRRLAQDYPGRVSGFVGYHNQLAHKVEAGADLFLMPSLFEPCGLNQMYSLKYGTVPIVRATGGLDDTVDTETGFKFWGYSSVDFLTAIRAALKEYSQDPAGWRARVLRGMNRDYSWTSSARLYSELFGRLLKGAAL